MVAYKYCLVKKKKEKANRALKYQNIQKFMKMSI